MADQRFALGIGEFFLDLHYTERAEAKRIVRRRLVECCQFGIRILKIVYGSPDNFSGSVAEAVFEIVRDNELVALEMLPPFVFLPCPEPDDISTSIRIFLRPNKNPQAMRSDTQFA